MKDKMGILTIMKIYVQRT